MVRCGSDWMHAEALGSKLRRIILLPVGNIHAIMSHRHRLGNNMCHNVVGKSKHRALKRVALPLIDLGWLEHLDSWVYRYHESLI